MNENRKYAIFIDGDNISPRYLESILSEVSKEGEILVRRIYGDWTTTNMNGWKDLLLKIPVRPVQQFRNGLNATDNAIIMDAIELANTNKEINAIFIVAAGVYGACRAVLSLGKQNDLTIIAFDTVPTTVEMMKKNVIKAVIYQHPYRQGQRAMQIVFEYLVNGISHDKSRHIMKNEIKILENL